MAAKFTISADDIVVIIFALLGFGGCIVFAQWGSVPPIVVSFLLATGVAAFVYRFLGGIQGASFTVGALKLGGTLAALVGIALAVNPLLVDQMHFRMTREDDMVGEWRWVYAAEGWEGHLTFKKDDKGNLIFAGEESKWNNGKRESLFELSNGVARLTGRNRLELSADVHDLQYGTNYHWVQTAPFVLAPTFRGEVRRDNDDGNRWGMMFYKWPVTQ
jgi:hypothetical protein